MNLILVSQEDFIAADRVRLDDRRYEHIRLVHRAAVGDQLRIGLLNGQMGTGLLVAQTERAVELQVCFNQAPPDPLPVTLLLALPRPKMLKRTLQTVTALGVKKIYLINSYRVDKSYWNSPLLETEKLHEHLLLGLEQARDTIMPQVELRPRFKPFVEDELPRISTGTSRFVAHPVAASDCPHNYRQPTTLAIGPEGGFIDYEIGKLQEYGFTPITLGQRILRVETAVPVLLSRFSAL